MMSCVVLQVLPGGHGARTYQDERFSYVVLRRGARPTPDTVPELTIARQRQIDPPDAVQQAIEAGEISLFGAQKLCQRPEATLYCKGAITPTSHSVLQWGNPMARANHTARGNHTAYAHHACWSCWKTQHKVESDGHHVCVLM